MDSGVKKLVTKYKKNAILIGCSKTDNRQKSLCEFYDFLLSNEGGAWEESELTIFPNGIDLSILKLSLKNLSEENTDFLLVYFCGKAQDKRFSEGFQFDGIQLKIKNFFQNYCDENSIESIICIFDSCENFIEDNPTELSDEDISNSIMDLKNISESIVVSEKVNTIRTLFEEKLKKIEGFYFLCGCDFDENPVLDKNGNGVFTKALLQEVQSHFVFNKTENEFDDRQIQNSNDFSIELLQNITKVKCKMEKEMNR